MFKRKLSKDIKIDTLIGVKTSIHGDVEFAGGLHLDGRINGDVKGALEPQHPGRVQMDTVEAGKVMHRGGEPHLFTVAPRLGSLLPGRRHRSGWRRWRQRPGRCACRQPAAPVRVQRGDTGARQQRLKLRQARRAGRRIAAVAGLVRSRRKICKHKHQFGHDVVW